MSLKTIKVLLDFDVNNVWKEAPNTVLNTNILAGKLRRGFGKIIFKTHKNFQKFR